MNNYRTFQNCNMKTLKVRRGLDLNIAGQPENDLPPIKKISKIALDVSYIPNLRVHLQKKVGDTVKKGEPIIQNKGSPGVYFAAPCSGQISEIRRGEKRSLTTVVINEDGSIEPFKYDPVDLSGSSREQIVETMKKTGLSGHIRKRPFDVPANMDKSPRSIFIRAIETAPFVPSAEKQVEGYETEFAHGLEVLKKLTDGPVFLVCKATTSSPTFTNAKNVEIRQVAGPHPASSPSIHIQWLDPIVHENDVVWTIDVHGVISLGIFFSTGNFCSEKWISIAGPEICADQRGFTKAPIGASIGEILQSAFASREDLRIISGDPLCGKAVTCEDFLGFYDTSISAFPEKTPPEMLHFMRLGSKKFTATRNYLSGFLSSRKPYEFSALLHGEKRPFIDGGIYEKVMPLRIPVMLLTKAILAEDFEQAKRLGILEIAKEDFALPAFICPSKIELLDILLEGQKKYLEQMVH